MESKDGANQQALKMMLAGVLGQVGCVTVIVIVAVMGLGIWLDSVFNTRPLIMIAGLLASVPFTIYLMVRIVLSLAPKTQMTAHSQSPAAPETTVEKEEAQGGEYPGDKT